MKTIERICVIIYLILGACCFAACGGDDDKDTSGSGVASIPYIFIPQQNVELLSSGETKIVSIHSNCSWEIVKGNDAEWLSVSQLSGTGSVDIQLSATKNEKDTRSTILTVLGDGEEHKIEVKQEYSHEISYTLEGTWEGQVFDYSQWDGQTYNISYSMLDFRMDPFATRTGNGYWVDIYSGGSRHYVSYRIDWKVRDGIIYIKFREDGTTYRISDYRLSDYTFRGTMHEADWNTGNYNGNAHDFSMRHIDSPNWDYYYSDYDSFWSSYVNNLKRYFSDGNE